MQKLFVLFANLQAVGPDLDFDIDKGTFRTGASLGLSRAAPRIRPANICITIVNKGTYVHRNRDLIHISMSRLLQRRSGIFQADRHRPELAAECSVISLGWLIHASPGGKDFGIGGVAVDTGRPTANSPQPSLCADRRFYNLPEPLQEHGAHVPIHRPVITGKREVGDRAPVRLAALHDISLAG